MYLYECVSIFQFLKLTKYNIISFGALGKLTCVFISFLNYYTRFHEVSMNLPLRSASITVLFQRTKRSLSVYKSNNNNSNQKNSEWKTEANFERHRKALKCTARWLVEDWCFQKILEDSNQPNWNNEKEIKEEGAFV